MNRQQLSTAIAEAAKLTGTFTLRSGQTATTYFDKYRFEARPDLLREVAKVMASMVPAEAEVLAGLELGGVPIATALSLDTGLPAAFVRKERKAYGTQRLAEGTDLAGRKVLIVEDVITTGGQVALSAADLRNEGADLIGVLCTIYRGPGAPHIADDPALSVSALFAADDLV